MRISTLISPVKKFFFNAPGLSSPGKAHNKQVQNIGTYNISDGKIMVSFQHAGDRCSQFRQACPKRDDGEPDNSSRDFEPQRNRAGSLNECFGAEDKKGQT